ncbi:MAG: hypothetical protein AAF717_21290 [Bacteroidota bacterium]|nr:hypothetical protein [uncultured Allomuricauda sp.]
MEKNKSLADIEKDLKNAKLRFLEVVRHGDGVISEYDLMMGYDADFYLNQCPILAGHIIYYRKELKEAQKNGVQTKLF